MTTILPSVAVLELTYRCNHACRFCSCPWYAGMLKPGPEMEVGEWKRLIEVYSAALVAGADSLLLNRFLPGGRGLSHPELMLTADDVRHAADVAEEVLSRAKRHGHFGTELPDCMIDAGKYEYLNVTTGCSAATDFFTVGPNGRLRVCNHSPVELLKWNEWERLPECEEWMHYVRHDYLPKMCDGCDKAAKCLGGCREAARVFGGSPTAPDPIF